MHLFEVFSAPSHPKQTHTLLLGRIFPQEPHKFLNYQEGCSISLTLQPNDWADHGHDLFRSGQDFKGDQK